MNLYLLRVGADTNFYSHRNEDRSYIFIPIPDDENSLITDLARTYQNYTWNGIPVHNHLPEKILTRYIHDDPEFKTFTYGSPEFNTKGKPGRTEKNYRKLLQMQKGDILVFYAAFTRNGTDIEGYYFFAYFIIVDRAVNLNKLTNEEMDLVKGNHHFIHKCKLLPQNQVIVKGCPEQSRFLEKAVLLSSRENDRGGGNYYPCQSVRQRLGGYCKSMNRSSIRGIDLPEKGILQFKHYLDNNSV
jgi:hypothetical protein